MKTTVKKDILNSNGKKIPVRMIREQHVTEDLGYTPTVSDWLQLIPYKAWMTKKSKTDIDEIPNIEVSHSKELEVI